MKAFVVDRYGRKQSLRFGEMPNPELREDDVLVRVHAAGVNPLDSKIRDGEFKLILPYRLPLILGNDVAGVVVQVGSRVRRFKLGDEVYARPHHDRIDATLEFVLSERATGTVMNVQVKGTESEVRISDSKIAAYLDADHVEYWTTHDWPVLYAKVDLLNERVWVKRVDRLAELERTPTGFRLSLHASLDDLNKMPPHQLTNLAMPSRKDPMFLEYVRLETAIGKLRVQNPIQESELGQIERAKLVNQVSHELNRLEEMCNLSPTKYTTMFRGKIFALRDYAGTTIVHENLYEQDSLDKPYLRPNYRQVLLELEAEGKITCSKHNKNTLAKHIEITFP